jgi:hypothetical protein
MARSESWGDLSFDDDHMAGTRCLKILGGMTSGSTTEEDRRCWHSFAMTSGTATLLWFLAVILVIAGIIALFRGGVLAGAALIIIGLLVGPGGATVFK